ncbi:DUF2188 domain-containing protein [Streptomyces fuscigenes]|uniref:DUF2188 domain-containing protein n=1 Tax=Streptomyces fuscigenes TaxID=1528880 RepID=UPI001F310B72|nr:DUF2188 domain-containing protein [Streptomyces fuscigenes]
MPQPRTYHVTQRPDGQWQAKAADGTRASAVARTQAGADRRAAEILRNNGGGELVKHGRDGTIVDKRTIAPGNDPFPPRG